jgi:hypothetical protein
MAESVVLALSIEIALRLMPFASLLARLDRLRPGVAAAPTDTLDRLHRFASMACRLLPVKTTCLRESLVFYALLRRRGASPRLCLGVNKHGTRLHAHAWIECAGITEPEVSPEFSPLASSL